MTSRDRQSAIDAVRAEARRCRACDLWERGTQTVFGEGPVGARVLFVGEQPGDQEDEAGRPFVGPAGRMLHRALADAGINRDTVFVTNAVKHFKWVAKGKRRIHEKPNRAEVRACHPWLEQELAIVKPEVVVLLGATAAQALLGPSFRVTAQRGQMLASPFAPFALATVHPSSLLRAPTDEARRLAYEAFVRDLRVVASHLEARSPAD